MRPSLTLPIYSLCRNIKFHDEKDDSAKGIEIDNKNV